MLSSEDADPLFLPFAMFERGAIDEDGDGDGDGVSFDLLIFCSLVKHGNTVGSLHSFVFSHHNAVWRVWSTKNLGFKTYIIAQEAAMSQPFRHL